jgi:hypothetical protein
MRVTAAKRLSDRTAQRDTVLFLRAVVRFAWADLRRFTSAKHAISEFFRHAYIVPDYSEGPPFAGFRLSDTEPRIQGRSVRQVESLYDLQRKLRGLLEVLSVSVSAIRPTPESARSFGWTAIQMRDAWRVSSAQSLVIPPEVAKQIDRCLPRLRFLNSSLFPDYEDDLPKLLHYGIALAIQRGALKRLGVCGDCRRPVVRLLDRAEPGGLVFCDDRCRTRFHNERRRNEQAAGAEGRGRKKGSGRKRKT